MTDLRDRTIVLHVANYPALWPHVLAWARARVEKVYEGIGVRIVWVESDDTVRQGQDGRRHLTAILLSRDMAAKKISAERTPAHVLGQAHLALLSIPLGNVIAHEVGRLLLRENSHSHKGLMRANVDLQSMQRQNFDTSQTTAIRTSWSTPAQPAPLDDLR